MLEDMMNKAIDNKIAKKYPHIQLPSVITARVISVTQSGDLYKYDLKIIDKFGVIDNDYPTIPNVLSKLSFENNTVLVIALLYGELNPYIIGEVS